LVPGEEPAIGRPRSGDLREEGVDGPQDRLLIATGDPVQALEAAQESAVRRPSRAAYGARRALRRARAASMAAWMRAAPVA
jgi:hypothetical protein